MAESVDALDLKSNRGSPSVPVQVWPGANLRPFQKSGLFICRFYVRYHANLFFTSFIFNMGFTSALEKSLTKFGMNNSPSVVAMGVATAKGIFRPMFTMMDKKEDYQTKRYTAFREGLTEMIAIPIYYLSGILSKNLAKKIAIPKNFMSKDIFEKSKGANVSEEVQNIVKHAELLAKENFPKIQSNISFIGVCVSALFIIPLICSVTIKPIMAKLDKRPQNENVKPKTVNKIETNNKVNPYANVSSGMKVGGV